MKGLFGIDLTIGKTFRLSLVFLLACELAAPMTAQIAPDHPELCARPGGVVPLPANVWASVRLNLMLFKVGEPKWKLGKRVLRKLGVRPYKK